MKTYQDKRTFDDRDWDVMVAEEGDYKVFIPFFCPPDQDAGRIIQRATRIAEFALKAELGTTR